MLTSGKGLTDIAVDNLINLILEHKMQAGDKLPSEAELSELLGVGRSTLREAVHRLVSRNILVVRQGAGTFVAEAMGVPQDPLGLTFMGRTPSVALNLMDIRLLLEPEICSIVAHTATPEQLEQLREYCEKFSLIISQGEDYTEMDERFHCYLASCSGNQVLENLISIIISSIHVNIVLTNDAHRQRSLKDHIDIVEAICRRDAVGARCCMVSHLNTSRDTLSKEIQKINNSR